MKKDFLFPAYCKKIGWIATVPFMMVCILLLAEAHIRGTYIYDFLGGYLDETGCVGLIIALLLVAFSREKDEDEYVARLRSSSLIWAVIVNYLILIVLILSLYGLLFLYAAWINMFLVLVLYIIKFNVSLYKFRRSTDHEE